MKFMLLIYNNPATYEAWSEDERNALFGEVEALMGELRESGEWVGGEALMDAAFAKTVRVRWNTTVVTGDLVARVTTLKRTIERDLVLIGGATIAGTLVRLGLVDEHHVFTHPVLLGGGQRLYPPTDARIRLELVEATTFGGGVVLHRHAATPVA